MEVLQNSVKDVKKKNDVAYNIPKGSVMYRSVINESKNFMDREYTYVNFTDSLAEHLYEVGPSASEPFDAAYKLKTTKNLKIASVDEYFNAVMAANGIDPQIYIDQVPSNVKQKGQYAVLELLPYQLTEGVGGRYESFNNAITYLKKEGYDGVVDPQDGAVDERDHGKAMAMVVFDPKKTIKIVNKSTW